MAYPWLTPLLAALATLTLTILVIRKGPNTELTHVFAFLTSMAVFWNLNFFVLYLVSDRDLAFSLSRVFRTGIVFMPPAILHVFLALRRRESPIWRNALRADYGFACGLAIANAFDLLVADLRKFPWGYATIGTGYYHLFTIFAIANCCAAGTLIVHDYRTSTEPRMRQQLKFWMVGAAIGLPLGLSNLLPSYGIPLYPLGNLGNVAWAAIVAYAIVRHRLMDIDVVVTKGIAYATVSLILIAPAFSLMLWLQRQSFGLVHPDFSFVVLLLFVAIGVLFPTLRRQTESRVGRSLFREKHEHRVALTAFTRSIVRILDRERLFHELAGTLTQTLDLDRVAVALVDDSKRAYTVQYAVGIPPAVAEIPDEHELIASLTRREDSVLRDELELSHDASERTAAADLCRRNGWEACVPLTVSGQLMGFIALGRKRNLDTFSAEDLQLLATLAAEAAIALENARLYDELKKSRDIIHRTGRLSALGTLAAGIAHEVRNPLVSIQTFFQLAPQRLHDEEFFTSFLRLTAGEVQRISDLITELLTFAKSPAHALHDVEINDLIERTTILLEPEARKQRVKLARDLAPDLPLIRADGDQVKQIVINLILNAIQANEIGGSVIVFTRMVTRADGRFCQIEVRDTGIGIPPKMLEDIFNPFFTTKDKGTGLGLSIAHQIVTEHGGFITVTSEEGQGSSFFVNLPAAAADPQAAEVNAVADLPLRYGRMGKL